MIYFLIVAAVFVVFLAFRSGLSDPHAWDFLPNIEMDVEGFNSMMEETSKESDTCLDPGYSNLSCNICHIPGEDD